MDKTVKSQDTKSGTLELLLHIGLPKTASTALQMWCHTNRDALLARGIFYPTNPWQPHLAHNHQFLVGCLLNQDFERLRGALQAAPATRVCLSTEGLTSHLYSFSENSLREFRAVLSAYRVHLFVVLRDPADWIRSYYKQTLINPPLKKYDFATSLDLSAFASLPRIKRLTDTPQLLDDVKIAFGAHSVTKASYEDDWFGSFLTFLGLQSSEVPAMPAPTNISLSDEVAELIRQINGLPLEPAERGHCLWLLAQQLHDVPHAMKTYRPLPPGDPRRSSAEKALRRLASISFSNKQLLLAALKD